MVAVSLCCDSRHGETGRKPRSGPRQTTVIGYEQTGVLDVCPAEYYVKVIRRERRACRNCEEQGVQTAPVLERIVAKSVLSDQVIIAAVVAKYCASLPLYRQQAMIKRDAGVEIALSTLNDGFCRRRVTDTDLGGDEARGAGRNLQTGRRNASRHANT
jgi:transposase